MTLHPFFKASIKRTNYATDSHSNNKLISYTHIKFFRIKHICYMHVFHVNSYGLDMYLISFPNEMYMKYTLGKKVVTPPLKTIKPMWIELLCFHLAEIGMIWTRDFSPTKSDTTLGRHMLTSSAPLRNEVALTCTTCLSTKSSKTNPRAVSPLGLIDIARFM